MNQEQEKEEIIIYTGDEAITPDTNIDVADHIELAKEKKSHSLFGKILYHLRIIFSIRDDVASHEEIKERILSSGKFKGSNMVIMCCAILIASVGLNTNSIATIIGAMLISPLMSRILVLSYGTASNDIHSVLRGLGGFALQVIISISVSCIYFLISPIKDATEQILLRTQPTIFDVIVACAGGIAGIIGQTRKSQYNNVIPGVAIATALMPPLCVVGYSLANSQWLMMGMAFYLFFINFYFIYFSGVIVLNILEVPKVRSFTVRQWKATRFRMIRNTVIILIPVIILTVLYFLHIFPSNTVSQ
jgi:uncharacterized hydrophobic protein (TIGR00271 family)